MCVRPDRSYADGMSRRSRAETRPTGTTHRRRAETNRSTAFVSGPAELLDFVLPIVAGQFLGATGAQTGALVATTLFVSLLARPCAGRIVDRFEGSRGHPHADEGSRRSRAAGVAACGAAVSAVSFLVYAVSTSLTPAFCAAVLGGIGGAFFWVAIRALVAMRSESGSERFAELMENESGGSWIAFIIGIPLLQLAGPPLVFLACAGSCLLAAMLLGRTWVRDRTLHTGRADMDGRVQIPARQRETAEDSAAAANHPHDRSHTPVGATGLFRPMLPILVLTAVIACAEGIVSLLLILRLQHDLGLEIGTIALVYLPGAIVLSVAPRPLHRLFRRTRPGWILFIGLSCSAGFAAALASRPDALALAVLWVLSALCWSLLIPLLERLVAEVSGPRVGAGFGHYQSAELLGAACGSLLAGILYTSGLWTPAAIAAAVFLIAAAALGPISLGGLPVADSAPRRKGLTPAMRKGIRTTVIHIGIYLLAQAIFALVAQSWPWEVITGGTEVTTILSWTAEGTDLQRWIGAISRIWTIVVIVDIVWSALSLGRHAGGDERSDAHATPRR